jgi:Transposase DDE domain
MIFATSLPGFKAFLGRTASSCADFSCCLLLVVGFLLPAAKRSVKAAARSIRDDCRDPGRLLHFLLGSNSPAGLLAAAQHRLLHDARERSDRLHLLLLDSTQHTQHGARAENTFARGNTKPRAKQSARQQQKVHRKSCHTFVFALLLCPCGLRIPYWIPFYTKEYCDRRGWKHQTQADLAAQLITALPLARSVPVVVVGDTAFEAKQIRSACARRNYQWIVPINPERRLAQAKPRPKVLSLIERLKGADFHKTSFRLDQGELAALARVSSSRVRSSKHRRVYWVHRRTADVLSVGEVVLLFSNQKEPTATTAQGVRVQKVLMSNALQAGVEELLRWYGLRWQIELFFKEMKGELGMCQYKARPFERVVGWVNLCVLSYCYLQWYRWQQLQRVAAKEKEYWLRARAHDLRGQLRREVEKADVFELLRLANLRRGQKRLNDLLKNGYDDPAAKPRRQGRA